MKKLVAALLITAVAGLGCGEESEPGGPGAQPAPTGANGANGANGIVGDRELQDEENTFTITVPTGATNIEAGARQEVSISVDREDRFTEAVTLSFQAPQGITVTPAEVTVQPNQDEATVTVMADPTARPGTQRINVTATPASGQNPTSQAFEIEIEAAEGREGAAGRQPTGRQPLDGQQPLDRQPPAGRQPLDRQPPAGGEQPAAEPAPVEQP